MGGVGRAGTRPVATRWLALLGAATLAGCATQVVRADGGFRDRDAGWTIGTPPGPDGYWRRDDLGGAQLAFRGGRGERISLAARCGGVPAPAWILARHLRIGVPEHRLRASGRLQVDGLEGWMQIFDARAEHGTVRVKTVTLAANPCTYDWVLAARDGFDSAEPLFDSWWSSFRLPAAETTP